MTKATKMDEIMIEMSVDPDILNRVKNQAIGGGFFKGTIPDVKVDPVVE
jgi:hypothetical protein